jgi:hypothetical protein
MAYPPRKPPIGFLVTVVAAAGVAVSVRLRADVRKVALVGRRGVGARRRNREDAVKRVRMAVGGVLLVFALGVVGYRSMVG